MAIIRKHRVVRFLFVGAINSVVGYSTIFLLLDAFQWGYWPSTICGNVVGAIVSYFLSYDLGNRAVIALASTSLANETVTKNIAVLFSMVLYTLTNYLGQKFLVFQTAEAQRVFR